MLIHKRKIDDRCDISRKATTEKKEHTKYGTGVIICLPISIQLHKKGKT